MELTRLTVRLAQLESVPDAVAQRSGPVVLSCSDADAVMAAASLRERLRGPLGVWLAVSPDYPAAMAARDVATLSWLIDVEHVVISAPSRVQSHADVVRALLSDDEVNFANDVAVIAHAYNRPAPPRPITVWSFDGEVLGHGDTALRQRSYSPSETGTATLFS